MRRLLEDALQAAAAAGAGALMLWAGHVLRGPAPGFGDSFRSLTDLQSAAGLAAGWAGLLMLAWWTVGLGAAFLSAALLRCGKHRAAGAVGRLSPGFFKRLAAAALGLQLAVAPLPALAAPPAQAASAASMGTEHTGPGLSLAGVSPSPVADPTWQVPQTAPPPSAYDGDPAGSVSSQRDDSAVDPAWKPTPGPVSGSLLIPGGTRELAQGAVTVTVTAGDTLWDLAAAQLGTLATDHEIAGYWPAWHEMNRSVIGSDPHRLLPGQVLAVPPPPAH